MTLATQQTNSAFNLTTPETAFFNRTIETGIISEEIIQISQIQKAAARIAPFIKRTPTIEDEALSRRFESNFYLKLELLQNTGAFKVRGAFNKMLTLSEEEKTRGVVAVSGGNHAKAVAFAAQTLGFQALILMPDFTPENYINETKGYGAEVELFPTMAEAFRRAKEYESEGRINIHPFDDEIVIAGQGTIGLEILEDVPQVTDVIVSIGGGGLAGGVAAAIKAIKPGVKIWGVETKGAESMAKALEAGHIVELEKITSIARTLGAPAVAPITFELARKYLSGVTVVSDEEAVEELFYILDHAKVLTEPATSCTLAAAKRLSANFTAESHVVLILCGGNIGLNDLFQLA
ncbi:MAG: Pyridoxal-5-phosphate-dependent protein beta subunit [Acidobacteria bacterium]|jgi:threonine dehydratase|nr:Pyridoxal-5-phosphate-dependent protein beta subunit [Acidobacteriota bacterium]